MCYRATASENCKVQLTDSPIPAATPAPETAIETAPAVTTEAPHSSSAPIGAIVGGVVGGLGEHSRTDPPGSGGAVGWRRGWGWRDTLAWWTAATAGSCIPTATSLFSPFLPPCAAVLCLLAGSVYWLRVRRKRKSASVQPLEASKLVPRQPALGSVDVLPPPTGSLSGTESLSHDLTASYITTLGGAGGIPYAGQFAPRQAGASLPFLAAQAMSNPRCIGVCFLHLVPPHLPQPGPSTAPSSPSRGDPLLAWVSSQLLTQSSGGSAPAGSHPSSGTPPPSSPRAGGQPPSGPSGASEHLAAAMELWQVQWRDIKIDRLLGRGSFGNVRKAQQQLFTCRGGAPEDVRRSQLGVALPSHHRRTTCNRPTCHRPQMHAPRFTWAPGARRW